VSLYACDRCGLGTTSASSSTWWPLYMSMMFEIVVDILYTLEARLSISGGSKGSGLSRSDGVVLIELLYESAFKLVLDRDAPSSRAIFCNLSKELDGGGETGPFRGDLGGARNSLSRRIVICAGLTAMVPLHDDGTFEDLSMSKDRYQLLTTHNW
jgi:hypothetical protein